MKINNFQIMVGDSRCNAKCKYCVSRLTYSLPKHGGSYFKLHQVKLLARKLGITTAIITGKGEPTLSNKGNLKDIIYRLSEEFPIVELQTNGINLTEKDIEEYHSNGLTTICISRGHYDDKKNKELMGVTQNINKFKDIEFPICKRLTVTLCKGYIDSGSKVEILLDYAKGLGFEQVTLHPVGLPYSTKDKSVYQWIKKHSLYSSDLSDIYRYFYNYGTLIYKFDWGGEMYSLKDLTVVIGFCMDNERQRKKGNFHSLILGTDGHVRLSWEHKGSVIL